MIAIITSITTIVVATLPWLLSRLDSPAQEPTAIPTTAIPATLEPTATFTLTPSPEPPTPTETPTPAVTDTPETGIFDVFLARDVDGIFRQASFKSTELIYVFFSVNDPLGRNVVRVSFKAAKVPGFLNGAEVYFYEDQFRNPVVVLETNQSKKMKPGTYLLEISLNGKVDETLEFEITE
jgi:hypothetical protein